MKEQQKIHLVVSVHIDLTKENKITWMKIPGAANNNYLPRMMWGPSSNELYIQQLNRKQNHSKIFIADALTGSVKLLREEKIKIA